jgi:hypothetical protein
VITPPKEWLRSAAHQMLLLRPPVGEGRVRCYLQLPLEPFAAVVRRVVDADPGFVAESRDGPHRLSTLEGEFGCWAELVGTLRGRPARRWIAAIVLDASVVAIDGLSVDPDADVAISGCARHVFETASFGLGVRRRRYVYARPPGWHALAHGLVTTFYAPDYPNHRAQLVVYPAEPSSSSPVEVFDALLADETRRGFEPAGPVTAEPFVWSLFSACHFSHAGRWRSDPGHFSRDAVVLADGRYYYVMRLESATPDRVEEARLALRDLALSVEPLPSPGDGGRRPDAVRLTEVGGQWAE